MTPNSIIQTKRLCLRPFQISDAKGLFDLNADPLVMRYTGGDPPFESEAHAREFVQNYHHYEQYGYGRWTVLHLDNGTFLGWCGLKWHPDEQYVDLGYRFLRKYWGKGYATEAARACLKVGFETFGLQEIIGRVIPENQPSVKVLEKIGMQFWKVAPCGDFQGADYYRITQQTYLDLKQEPQI